MKRVLTIVVVFGCCAAVAPFFRARPDDAQWKALELERSLERVQLADVPRDLREPLETWSAASLARMKRLYREIAYRADAAGRRRPIARQTGLPGCNEAIERLREEFLAAGFTEGQVKVFDERVTVPVDHDSRIDVLAGDGRTETIRAHALVPNNVNAGTTAREPIEGALVYVGRGTAGEMVGVDLRGAVALMEFACGERWLDAAAFGARAVVFLAPDFTTFREADTKYLETVPLNLPTPNLEVRLPGTAQEPGIMFMSHVDARGVVPGLAFGGDELWGALGVVELARHFKANRPRRSVRFLLFTGHWQSQVCGRQYVTRMRHELGRGYGPKMATPVKMALGVDLSTESRALAITHNGYPAFASRHLYHDLRLLIYGEGRKGGDEGWHMELLNRTGKVYQFHAGSRVPLGGNADYLADYQQRIPFTMGPKFYTANEPVLAVGGLTVTFQTAKMYRYFHNTPLDTPDRSLARAENLREQMEMMRFFADKFANLPEYSDQGEQIIGNHVTFERSRQRRVGFQEIVGAVYRWDEGRGAHRVGTPHGPDGRPLRTLVYIYGLDTQYRHGWGVGFLDHPAAPLRWFHRSLQSFMVRYVVEPDENGAFRIPAVWGTGRWARYVGMAFAFDEAGRILYAPDFGQRGHSEFRFAEKESDGPIYRMNVVIFPCASLTLFNLVDQKRYNWGEPVLDEYTGYDRLRHQDVAASPYLRLYEVREIATHTELDQYGFVQWRGTGMAFIEPDRPAEILLGGQIARKNAVLTGDPGPDGRPTGYRLPLGANLVLRPTSNERLRQWHELPGCGNLRLGPTSLVLMRQLHSLVGSRQERYARFGVKSRSAEVDQRGAGRLIKRAERELAEGHVGRARATLGIGLERQSAAYDGTLTLLQDVVATTILYFILLLPFSFLVERLLLPQRNFPRTCAVALAVFACFVALLWTFHPGFRLASNIWVAIASFLIVVLTAPALIMILVRGFAMIKAAGQRAFRRHESEAERIGVLVAALGLSISNMRRRKLRTALTLSTITLLVVALVLLTQSTSFTHVFQEPTPFEFGQYRGITVRNSHAYVHALLPQNVRLIREALGDRVTTVERAAVSYGYSTAQTRERLRTRARKILEMKDTGPILSKEAVDVPLFWIAGPEDAEAHDLNRAIVSGRWFDRADVFAVLLGRYMADTLGAAVGDRIRLEGLDLAVVGIYDPTEMDSFVDLDGGMITPIQNWERAMDPEHPKYLSSREVLIIPRRLMEETRFAWWCTWGMALIPTKQTDAEIRLIATWLARRIPSLDVYFTQRDADTGKDAVYLLSAYRRTTIKGATLMVMPLVAAFFMILSVMMGSVYERRSDINIFSAVGLSPGHVAGMFFVESVVYAGIASVAGYLIAVMGLDIFRRTDRLPELFYPNYLGKFVIYSFVLSVVATVSSSIYPMIVASRVANPSLERSWQPATRPEGDRWRIDFPFIATTDEEVTGILAFLQEFIGFHKGERAGVFSLLDEARQMGAVAGGKLGISCRVWLAPYNMNVVQRNALHAFFVPDKSRWEFDIDIERESGALDSWERSNKAFLDAIRKQMLVWRVMTDEGMREYAERWGEEE